MYAANYGTTHSRFSRLLGLMILAWGLLAASRTLAQVAVLTQHNDTSRTGANLNETILKPANVNVNQFGKLFTRTLDGEVYAQPLYVSGVTVPGKGTHNVVYAATMNNTVYAFEADDAAAATPLWSVNLGPAIPASDVQCCCPDISVKVGILGTPVIDPVTSTLYLVARNKNADGSYHQWLHALDITTGAEKFGGPKEITGQYGALTFNPKIQNQRPALLLLNGIVYIAWASHNDCGPYHGWVMGYNAATLQQASVYCDTPTGNLGGIWQAGQGPTADGEGNIYIITGNGSYSVDGSNLGNSFIKLSVPMGGGLQVTDWFTPYNSDSLNAADADLGAAGVLGLPGTNYLVGGGKQGVLYLLDRKNMGHFHSGNDSQVVQSFQAIFGNGSSHIHGSPIYYDSPANGPTIYIWGENDYLRAYAFNALSGLFKTAAIAKSTMTAPVINANGAMPGGFLSLSANGQQAGTGIVWATTPYNANANNAVVQGIFHAFDANTLQELWNDKQNSTRDQIGQFAKFCAPTVANGKVYVANFGATGSAIGSGQLVVYGLLPQTPPAVNTLTPIADAYTRSGIYAAQNFGTDKQLIAKVNPPDYTRYTYLKFDLTKITGNVTSAKLRLYGAREGVNSSSSDSAYAVGDTTWLETGITWNNMPALGAKLSTTTVTSTLGYYEWDVTSHVTAQQKAGAKMVTLAVKMDVLPADGYRDNFNSREAGSNPPQLTFTIAKTPNYPNGFANAADLTLNGSAKLNGSLLELTDGGTTEAGSAFFTTPVNITSFHNTFSFQLTNPSADGMTFTIQGNVPSALGGTGGGLGYGPDPGGGTGAAVASIGKSAAVKFDLYNNSGEGANSTGLFTNGASPVSPATDLTAGGIDLHSGHLFTVSMVYDGTTLTVTITDTSTGKTASQSYTVNLPALVGSSSGYVGFTGGTGGLTAKQDILTWVYGL